MDNQRPNWDETFMFEALWTATKSSCVYLKTGAVIVKDKRIIAKGYNGAGPNLQNCLERGCRKDQYGVGFDIKGKSICRGNHAEPNAMNQIPRERLLGTSIYSVYFPCSSCAKEIQANGISSVYYLMEYNDPDSLSLEIFEEGKIKVKKLELDLENDFNMMRNVLQQNNQ